MVLGYEIVNEVHVDGLVSRPGIAREAVWVTSEDVDEMTVRVPHEYVLADLSVDDRNGFPTGTTRNR
jgi:hypothetical protein